MERTSLLAVILVGVLVDATGLSAAEPPASWLAMADKLSGDHAAADARGVVPTASPTPGEVLHAARSHTIEGVGGGTIVPTAYLVSPKVKYGGIFGAPSVSGTFIGFPGKKNLFSLAISETLFERIELSYALSRFDTGNLNHVARKLINNSLKDRGIWMHNFNVRALLVRENQFCPYNPAVTAGVHFKLNCTIEDINDRLGIPLDTIGYEKSNGVDYTLTMTKTIEIDPLPKMIVTLGIRNTTGSNLGYLGFADECSTTIEFGVQAFVMKNLILSYEFRRKERIFDAPPVGGLLRGEENWHAIAAEYVFSENLSIIGGILFTGDIANKEDGVGPMLQVRWAF